MKYQIKAIFLLVCVTAFSSCATIAAHNQNDYKENIAGKIGCLPDQIQITSVPNSPSNGIYGISGIFNAECNGIQYVCSGVYPELSCAASK